MEYSSSSSRSDSHIVILYIPYLLCEHDLDTVAGWEP